MADATVLKTVGLIIRTGSSPVSGTTVQCGIPRRGISGVGFFVGARESLRESLAHRACSSRWARLAIALAFELSSAWA